MPRQLPWTNRGGGSRTQVKQPPAKKQRVVSDIDDDFFDGTVLASSRKGKERAEESDDDLPALPAEPSTPRTKSRTKDVHRKKRADSSSPPPIADLEQPRVESMHKGVSKFDLRDDEWMMVEDEFLETAKLFTRHLHIAEYEKLKERIEEKKKEAEAVRPVVAGAKLSVEGTMKEKAKVQEKRQRKAIRDVFASQQDDNGEKDVMSTRTSFSNATTPFAGSSRTAHIVSKRPPDPYAAHETDSDDLDAPRPANMAHKATRTPTPASILHATGSPSFAKPAPPLRTTASRASRVSRATPFDLLDDYTPRKSHSTPKPSADQHEARASLSLKSALQSSSPAKPSIAFATSTKGKVRPSVDPFDDWGSGGVSRETANRLAKRKAEREKAEKEKEKEKRTTVKSEDIPTFLF